MGEFGGGAALAITVEVIVEALVALGGRWDDPQGELEECGWRSGEGRLEGVVRCDPNFLDHHAD